MDEPMPSTAPLTPRNTQPAQGFPVAWSIRVALCMEKDGLRCDSYFYCPDGNVYRSFRAIEAAFPTIDLEYNLIRQQEDTIIKEALSSTQKPVANRAGAPPPPPLPNIPSAAPSSGWDMDTSSTDPIVPWTDRQWVACDLCTKWRVLPADLDQSELPSKWNCKMNHWDTSEASCDAEENVSDNDYFSLREQYPRLISLPPYLASLLFFTSEILAAQSRHKEFTTPTFPFNTHVTATEAALHAINPKWRTRMAFVGGNATSFSSLVQPLGENMRALMRGWTTGYKHMDRTLWSRACTRLKEAEMRCNPSMFAEALSLYLSALKPHNLNPSIGSEEARKSLIDSVNSHVLRCEAGITTTPSCCCCCYTIMKPSEIRRHVPTAGELQESAAATKKHSRFARCKRRKSEDVDPVKDVETEREDEKEQDVEFTGPSPAPIPVTPPPSEYELKRMKNIERNEERLASLGLIREEPHSEPLSEEPTTSTARTSTRGESGTHKRKTPASAPPLTRTNPERSKKFQTSDPSPSPPTPQPAAQDRNPDDVDGRFDPDPKVDRLPSFHPHPVFDSYMCLPCAGQYQETMREYSHDVKKQQQPQRKLKAFSPEIFTAEKTARSDRDYRCTLCSRASAPHKTSAKALPPDAASNVVCTGKSCDRSFCERCIIWLTGGSELRGAKEIAGWLCFVCRQHALVREDHASKMKAFLSEETEMREPTKHHEKEKQALVAVNANKYSSDYVPCTTFSQQNYLIDMANKHNKRIQLCQEELDGNYCAGGIRVLSLFAGIEVALVAVKQLGMKIGFWVVVEQDEQAINVVLSRHHDLVLEKKLVIVRDVHDITSDQIMAWKGGFDMVIGGSPCQDFSFQGNLNGGPRAGLEGDRGKLVYEFFRILRLVELQNKRTGFAGKLVYVYENVHGMSVEIKEEISSWLEVSPCQLNADQFSGACRPRDFYTNLPVSRLPGCEEDNEQRMPSLQQILTPPAKALTSKAKCIITSNGTEVFATGHTNEFFVNDMKWIEHFNRVLRSEWDESLGFRNLSIEEVERLFGLPRGYMSVVNSSRCKDQKACWSLMGNAFSTGVIVYLLSPLIGSFPRQKYDGYPYGIELEADLGEEREAKEMTKTKRPPQRFRASKEFAGFRSGCVYTTRERGTGYYYDNAEERGEAGGGAGKKKGKVWRPGLDSLGGRQVYLCCSVCSTWRIVPVEAEADFERKAFTCDRNVWSKAWSGRSCRVGGSGARGARGGDYAQRTDLESAEVEGGRGRLTFKAGVGALGVNVKECDDGAIRVVGVEAGSVVKEFGEDVKAGTIVREVNGKKVHTLTEYVDVLNVTGGEGGVELLFDNVKSREEALWEQENRHLWDDGGEGEGEEGGEEGAGVEEGEGGKRLREVNGELRVRLKQANALVEEAERRERETREVQRTLVAQMSVTLNVPVIVRKRGEEEGGRGRVSLSPVKGGNI